MNTEEIQQESLIKRLVRQVLSETAPRPLSRNVVTNLEADTELLEKTQHVRGPQEQLRQFFARTGLGAAQIRTMTREQITNFVRVATQNSVPGYFARTEDGTAGRYLDGHEGAAPFMSGKLIPDEEQLEQKIKSLLAPNEKLLSFIAKTGISTHQLRTLSLAEIRRLAHASGDNYLPPPSFRVRDAKARDVVVQAAAAYARSTRQADHPDVALVGA